MYIIKEMLVGTDNDINRRAHTHTAAAAAATHFWNDGTNSIA